MAANIKKGIHGTLDIGNRSVKIDGGFAENYVENMWMMMQQQQILSNEENAKP